ncbi:hypothetical protein TWF694_006352 [Orbilia ellipsospora]|uniref:Uncharacterized protein n=1 Tax=Orbilia ellipsospora TaxID=2528407 RepID=A0AAV9XLC1_9PEZI
MGFQGFWVSRLSVHGGIPSLKASFIIVLFSLAALITAIEPEEIKFDKNHLGENQQWIKDWAARSRQTLNDARLERGSTALTEDPEDVEWVEGADLVIVSRADWNEFETKLQIGKNGPVHYLLEAGRKFVLITETAIRLTDTIKDAIPKKNIDTNASIWGVYGVIFTIFTTPLYCRLDSASYPEVVAYAESVMNPPGGFASAYNIKDEVLLGIAKDAREILEQYKDARQPLNKGGDLYTPPKGPPTVLTERFSLTRMFDYNGGAKNDLNEIYINDVAFLYNWEDTFFVYKLLITYLDYMVDVVEEIWSKLAKELDTSKEWFMKPSVFGQYDRKEKGYQYYFDKKYKGSLGFIPRDAEIWNTWTNSDKSTFPQMLQDFMHALNFATRSALPLMMEMFGDIAVQARELGSKSLIELPDRFAELEEEVAIDGNTNLLKMYPEFWANKYVISK